MVSKFKSQRVISLLEKVKSETDDVELRDEIAEAIAVLLHDREHWARIREKREKGELNALRKP
jgi:hypothetical protein